MNITDAVLTGTMTDLKACVESGRYNVRQNGDEALRMAAEQGRINMVKYLVRTCGCDITVGSNSVLHSAAMDGYLNIVKYIMKDFPELSNSIKVFQMAARGGHVEIMNHLVVHSNALQVFVHHPSILRHAAECGHLKMVQYLVENCGVSVMVDASGALRMGVDKGHGPVVKYLVENGADINAMNGYALTSAAEREDIPLLRVLVKECHADVKNQCSDALRASAQHGYVEVMKELILMGADWERRRGELLVLSAEYGQIESVRFIGVSNGGSYDQDQHALRCAARKGSVDIVRYLLEHGVGKNGMKVEALYESICTKNLGVVRYLVQVGVEVNDKRLFSAAVSCGVLEIVKILVKNGLEIPENFKGLEVRDMAIRQWIQAYQQSVQEQNLLLPQRVFPNGKKRSL